MKKISFLAFVMSVILLSSCESKLKKLTNEMENETHEYIDAFNNAKSAEEVRAIERDFEERGKYYDKEFDKISNEVSIKEKQELMQNEDLKELNKDFKEARKKARDRFN